MSNNAAGGCQDDTSEEDGDRTLDGTAEAGDTGLDGTAEAGDRVLDSSADVGVAATAGDGDKAGDVTALGGLGATAEGGDTAEGGETTEDVSAEQALQAGSKAMEIISKIPFGKAKIKYHKSRICIQIGQTTQCVVDNEAPGDPEKIAKFVSVYSSMVKPEVSRNNRLSKKIKNVKNKKNNRNRKLWAHVFEG